MIHVCMPLYDKYETYSKYEGVAIYSLFFNTKESVTVHIIHDETLSGPNKKKFLQLADMFGQTILFYSVKSESYAAYEDLANNFSIGTLFRLSIPDLLPDDIDKIIYLDADIIVNLDIKELWDVGVTEYPLAACVDPNDINVIPDPCRRGEVDIRKYFNAGVMVLNLRHIRNRLNLMETSLRYLNNHTQCTMADQDALNSLFSKEYLRLDKKYNMFSRVLRAQNIGKHPCIVHVSGDYLNVEEPLWWDELFLNCWKMTPWKDEILSYFLKISALKKHQTDAYRKLLAHFSHRKKKIVIWGIASTLWVKIRKMIEVDREIDYAVDNSSEKQGTVIDGLKIYAPEKLKNESKEDVVVIVLSERYYREIKKQIESYGFVANENFFDGKLLLTQNQGGYSGYY